MTTALGSLLRFDPLIAATTRRRKLSDAVSVLGSHSVPVGYAAGATHEPSRVHAAGIPAARARWLRRKQGNPRTTS